MWTGKQLKIYDDSQTNIYMGKEKCGFVLCPQPRPFWLLALKIAYRLNEGYILISYNLLEEE